MCPHCGLRPLHHHTSASPEKERGAKSTYEGQSLVDERLPWSKLGVELEKHSLKRYAYLRLRNFVQYFTEGIFA